MIGVFSIKASEIAQAIGGDFEGEYEVAIRNVGSLDEVLAGKTHCLSWVKPGNEGRISGAPGKGVLWIASRKSRGEEVWQGRNVVFVDNPRLAFSHLLSVYFDQKREPRIEPSAYIADTAVLGDSCYVGHNVVIEDNVTVGASSIILHNTVIGRGTQIGSGSYIGSNCSIGMAGFGYEKDENGEWTAIPHVGNVVIGNGVRIHNNTCVDKAMLGSTVLSDEVKVDNLVHIAHGVQIGKNSLVIANAMVAGSVSIGENSWIAPSVSILNQARIGSNVSTGMGATIVKNVEDGQLVVGSPAEPIDQFKKWQSTRKRLME